MKSASKMFAVLESLCEDGDAGVSELASKLGLPKSSIFRFLSVLVENGYVKSGKKYQATLKTFRLGVMVRDRIDVVGVARPVMENLGKQVNETISLGFFDNNEVVYIHKVESSETVQSNYTVGCRMGAYCTAQGKVFLANLTPSEFEVYLETVKLESRTQNTIISTEKLLEEIRFIQTHGYGIDDGEYDSHNKCIAAPIRNELGRCVSALSISGPDFRMGRNRINELSKEIIMASEMISKNLGYRN